MKTFPALLIVSLSFVACSKSNDAATSTGPTGTTVTPVLTTITVAVAPASIQVGQAAIATATGHDQNGASMATGTITWSTGASTVATVTAAGAVTGVAAGQTQVIASAGGKLGQAALTVTAPVPAAVASVTVGPTTVILGAPGDASQLAAVLRDAAGNVLVGRAIVWSSSKPAVAAAVGQGSLANISAAGPGITQVTATSEGVNGSGTVAVLSSGGGNFTFSCTSMAGASIVGSNGQFLGRLTNALDTQSLMNLTGIYGSASSATSMYNLTGPYGSDSGPFSAHNTATNSPPILMVNTANVAWVSTNAALVTRVDADALRQCVFP